MAAPFCNEFVVTHMVYAAFFGFFSGGYVGLTSIVTVDLVGVDKLSDAFGVLLLFQGVAVAIGTPIVGKKKFRKKNKSNFIFNYLRYNA
jgi:predicted MFS family arabinose efflux permease